MMTIAARSRHEPRTPIDPRLDATLRYAIAIGAVLLLLLPAARGHHAQLGWLPLWLLAMPLSAWWTLHWFPLPGSALRPAAVAGARRRAIPQARRSLRPRR
ncbi:hypothetical protein, partial [Novilysobacter longmucuonensis]